MRILQAMARNNRGIRWALKVAMQPLGELARNGESAGYGSEPRQRECKEARGTPPEDRASCCVEEEQRTEEITLTTWRRGIAGPVAVRG